MTSNKEYHILIGKIQYPFSSNYYHLQDNIFLVLTITLVNKMKWYHWGLIATAAVVIFIPSVIITPIIPAYAYGLPKGTFVSKNFTINNMTAIPQSYGDKFDVLGILTYRGNATVSFTKVIVEVYNSSNQLVGLSEGIPSFYSLRPGDSTPFRVNTNVSQPAFDHYVVKVGVTTESNRLSNLLPMSNLQPHRNLTTLLTYKTD